MGAVKRFGSEPPPLNDNKPFPSYEDGLVVLHPPLKRKLFDSYHALLLFFINEGLLSGEDGFHGPCTPHQVLHGVSPRSAFLVG